MRIKFEWDIKHLLLCIMPKERISYITLYLKGWNKWVRIQQSVLPPVSVQTWTSYSFSLTLSLFICIINIKHNSNFLFQKKNLYCNFRNPEVELNQLHFDPKFYNIIRALFPFQFFVPLSFGVIWHWHSLW